MSVFDFRDYTCGYKMEEATGQAAIDEAGNQNLPVNGSPTLPGGITGKFDDARGPSQHLEASFLKEFIADSAYDIGGLTDICMAGWFQNNFKGLLNDPFSFSIHSPTVATGQAFIMRTGAGSGSDNTPLMWMADGLSLFNLKLLQFDDAVTGIISLDTWYFIAAGWRKDTNICYLFWGKAADEHYYIETAGFAAGFGYSGVGAFTRYGFHSNVGQQCEASFDHQLWWNGRALSQAELILLWNNHAGLDFDSLSSSSAGSGGARRFFYNKRPDK